MPNLNLFHLFCTHQKHRRLFSSLVAPRRSGCGGLTEDGEEDAGQEDLLNGGTPILIQI